MAFGTNGEAMKRNDVVLVDKNMYRFYGRVNRKIDDDHYEVIYCGRNWGIIHVSELELDNSYKGKPRWGQPEIFDRMPSLRKLKQMAAYYDKKVWKKNR